MQHPSHTHPAAVAWMTGALILFTGMAVAVREVSSEIGTIQILAVRSVAGLLIVSALLC